MYGGNRRCNRESFAGLGVVGEEVDEQGKG